MSETPDNLTAVTAELGEQPANAPPAAGAWPPAPNLAHGPDIASSAELSRSYVSPVSRARWTGGILALIVACDVAFIATIVLIVAGIWDSSSVVWLASLCFIGSAVLFVVNVPFFLIWLYRCSRNLSAFGVEGLRRKPDWVVACFFVPIINLYQPYAGVNDIWKASNPKLTLPIGDSWKKGRTSAVVGLWWLMWLVQALAIVDASDAESMLGSKAASSIGADCYYTLLNAIAGFLAILVVHSITKRQEEAACVLAEG